MISTDEEMKEINEIIGSLADNEPRDTTQIQVYDLLSKSVTELEVNSPELQKIIFNAVKNNGILHFKKSCTSPGDCMHGDEPWHSALVIADGEVFLSWETTKAIRNAAISQIFNDVFGGLFDK